MEQHHITCATRRTVLAGIAASLAPAPLIAQTQQPSRVLRIGVLMNKAADDPEGRGEVTAFVSRLQELGWTPGGNLEIDYRWGAGYADRYRSYAAELVALTPDLLLGVGGTVVGALQRATRTVPIVFAQVRDPVNRGLVANPARPGGNTTGFTQFEFSISGKWLELLKQVAPGITRAAVIRDPSQFNGVGELAAIQAVAPAFGVELTPIDARDTGEIERAIADFARKSNGGVIVTGSGAADRSRELLVTLAARHKLPAIYPYRY